MSNRKSTLQYQKLLSYMVDMGTINKDDPNIQSSLGIEAYRISTYMWEIKKCGGVVRPVKDGKKVVSYTLVNVEEMENYLKSQNKQSAPSEEVEEVVSEKLEDMSEEILESVPEVVSEIVPEEDELVVEELV